MSKRLAVYPLAAETGFGKHVSKSQIPRNERTTTKHVHRNEEGHEKSLIGAPAEGSQEPSAWPATGECECGTRNETPRFTYGG